MTRWPSLFLTFAMALVFGLGGPYPDPAPVHFRLNGAPDRWGAWWELPAALFTISALLTALTFAVGRERGLRSYGALNGLALILTAVHALMFVVAAAWVAGVADARVAPLTAPLWAWGVALAAIVAGVWLDRRVWGLDRDETVRTPTSTDADIEALQAAGRPWVYWSSQSPFYTRWLAPVLALLLLALAARQEGTSFERLLALGGAVVLVLLSGGFRTVVTRGRLVLRAGYLGLPLLRIPTADVAAVSVLTFSPFRDFGGWGIRRNRGITAFFLEGGTGVLIETRQSRKYLIGTDRPERLAAVLEAARQPADLAHPPIVS